jgi:hypothetical protein
MKWAGQAEKKKQGQTWTAPNEALGSQVGPIYIEAKERIPVFFGS